MKNMFVFDKDIFYKLVYGMAFGAITDPNNNYRFADTRVDMFFFSLQKYLKKFKDDILNIDLITLLSEHKSDWYELWENPGLFFEPSDNIYDTYNLYERDHGCGMWFNEFDKFGTEFIMQNIDVINSSIQRYIENLKHFGYYELMPISFKPDKNMNFLLPYLCERWKEFIADKKPLLESAETCARMEFKEISFNTAYEWMSANDLELWRYMTGRFNNTEDKYNISREFLIEDQNTKMHYIMLDGTPIGLIGFNSVYDSFYDESNDMLRSKNMFSIEQFRNGIGKRSLWVSFLEIKYVHSVENITSVMQKLCEYARAHNYVNMLCGAKDQRIKRLYMRAGWSPISDENRGLVLQYML